LIFGFHNSRPGQRQLHRLARGHGTRIQASSSRLRLLSG
jgi:hypothetical protein